MGGWHCERVGEEQETGAGGPRTHLTLFLFGQGPPRIVDHSHFGKFHQPGTEVFLNDVIINHLIKSLYQSIY